MSTYYPLGVEEMFVSFRHTYKTIDGNGDMSGPAGDSLLAEATNGVYPLDSTIRLRDGRREYIRSGAIITQSIHQILSRVGISLDAYNTDEPRDARPGIDRFPKFRTTGVRIKMHFEVDRLVLMGRSSSRFSRYCFALVRVQYSNKNQETGKPDASMTGLRADMSMEHIKGWAGYGALPTIELQGQENNTFQQITRYRQGVILQFDGKGKYYTFDFFAAASAIVIGSV